MSVLKKLAECHNLHAYLRTLPVGALDELYGFPAPCLAIFRELPKLAQHYVLRTLYVDQAVPKDIVKSWVSAEHVQDHSDAEMALKLLRIWKDTPMPGGLAGWAMNAKFRHYLKVALLGGGSVWTKSSQLKKDSKQRSIEELDAYAFGRWEALLHYLAEKPEKVEVVSRDVIGTLIHAGLMEIIGEKSPSITNEGFQFLLLDTASQVWYFLVKYLETVEKRGIKLVDCLAFLFTLSFGTLGKDYSDEGFDESIQQFIQNLREFGLLYQRTRKAGRFYPTKLALNVVSANRKASLNWGEHKTGFVIIETNYRLYAYTNSSLQLALVGMFTDFLYRFQNLVVGQVTRDSVRIQNSNSRVPPTIVDQIKLWEMERDRLIYQESVLYNQFLSQADFEVVRDYAEETKVLIHSNVQNRTIIVAKDGHDDVKRYWKNYSKNCLSVPTIYDSR